MKIISAGLFATALFALVSCTEGGMEGASGGTDGLDRSECIAYIFIDAAIRHEEGEITDQEFQDAKTKMSLKLQNKGDNFNYANTFRIFENRLDAIIEQNPTIGEVEEKVEECRPIVHI